MNRALQILILLYCTIFTLSNAGNSSLRSSVHTLAKREALIDPTYCANDRHKKLTDGGVKEVRKMLNVAKMRMKELHGYMKEVNPPPLKLADVKLASTFRTYSSMMYWDMPPQHGPSEIDQRHRPLNQLEWMTKFVGYMEKRLKDGNDHVRIFCTDRWLANHNNKEEPQPKPDLFWDRRVLDGEAASERHWIKMEEGKFKEKDIRLYVIVSENLAGEPKNAVILNQYQFDRWDGTERSEWNYTRFRDNNLQEYSSSTDTWSIVPIRGGGGESLSAINYLYKQKPRPQVGAIALSTMVRHHISAALLSAFSQVSSMTRHQRTLTSYPFDPADDVYGKTAWESVVERATERRILPPERPHPQNLVFLVVALYLDDHDWSKGFNRHLSSARRD